MEEVKDPAIKLFGRTIPLLVDGEEGGGEEDKELSDTDGIPESKDKDYESPSSDEKSKPLASSMPSDAPKAPTDEETPSMKNLKSEESQKDASNPQEKQPLKKPDKILPCPRCNSLDTKFCYYNNYNVNQPRHFCKNCQRYWTAGGTMRNVPVGAGRRKNKNSVRHVAVPAVTLQTLQTDTPESMHHLSTKPNGTVLSFGPDMPLCESIASILNLAEKTMKNCNRNGFHQMEDRMVRFPEVENGDEHSSGSSVTASSSNDEGAGSTSQEPVIRNCQKLSPSISSYNETTPWPYPWASAPPFCTPNFSVPFYPAAVYWGCAVPSTWSAPWITPVASPLTGGSLIPSSSSGSGHNSPTLGKHSREGIMLKSSNSENGDAPRKINQEGRIWVPKALRIDDPEEAAKSSIWAWIGIKNDKADVISGSGLFKAFQPKAKIKDCMSEASQVLHANPAALSRSLNFQESA